MFKENGFCLAKLKKKTKIIQRNILVNSYDLK